ncbi:three-Cys-motif partner protein TcmP [Dictyobacter arantiisoli]|uniref:Three-Cys-motif partner protein TcmP n=1 Tax=Dictyobacter arantiisoli TaxID=2014874 RepID=A0A5A5TKW6_9CHLR|nr:three-Cys-motif partner protein TcmP [Dictyobacter arantiisoli]GCF11888.1 hypothetical protein KDI_54520 [Dictyobacter arantiisoli]
MATPKSTIWSMDKHTQAKHEILRAYLQAWLPIMMQTYDRVLIIDGFAGPGIYQGGEIGSPLIALDVLCKHTYKVVRQKAVRFLFIEKNRKRCDNLETLLQQQELPSSLQCDIVCGEFADILNQELHTLEMNNKPGGLRRKVLPVFAFIDPFGYSQTPMSTIVRLMQLQGCEILFTFMYEEINRFMTADYSTKQQQYDDLFGTHEWIHMINIATTAEEREHFICELYKKQLQDMGHVKYVRYFRMINRHNATDYFLFFGTNDLKGLEKMKDAMWTVDRDDGYAFSDRTNQQQPQLFENGPDYDRLKRLIMSRFHGMTVTIEDIDHYVLVETPFRIAGYRENVLKPMEASSEIKIVANGMKRNRYTYPRGISISFQVEKAMQTKQMKLW